MRQTHIAVWLNTRHSALAPHSPGHGSLHFWLMQARWFSHCEFERHSGLQSGGCPIKVGRQEHDGESPIGRQAEFGPQGEGWHGFTDWLGSGSRTTCFTILRYWRYIKWLDLSVLGLHRYCITNRSTSCKRIALESDRTTTNGIVIYDRAFGVYATSSATRITAFLVGTRLTRRTFKVLSAFRSTGRRTTDVACNTRAHCLSIVFTTLTIGTTWRRMAWVLWNVN